MKMIILITVVLVTISSCCKTKTGEDNSSFVGRWVQVEPNCTDCDTLNFYKNGDLKSELEYFYYSYNIEEKGIVNINKGNGFNTYSFTFTNNDKTLIIEGYIPVLVGLELDKTIILNKL